MKKFFKKTTGLGRIAAFLAAAALVAALAACLNPSGGEEGTHTYDLVGENTQADGSGANDLTGGNTRTEGGGVNDPAGGNTQAEGGGANDPAGGNTQADGSGANDTDAQSVTDLSSIINDTLNLYISVWKSEDGNIIVSGNDVTISKSGAGNIESSVTVTVEDDCSIAGWELNGVSLSGYGTAQSVVISAADYGIGRHTLGVRVTKDGAYYSTEIHFTVTN